ncbi:glutaredoxin [Candidatus Poribacteria bacterium]|nr:MAG: glutaredoxin [Candidatus Poribacteria bacterium]
MQLQFYTKLDCSLCDEAKEVLESVKTKMSFIAIEEIDITKDLRLFTKYQHLIPVLELDGQRLFVHRIAEKKLMWRLRWYRFWRILIKLAS